MKHNGLSPLLKVSLKLIVLLILSSCQSNVSVRPSPIVIERTIKPIQLTNTSVPSVGDKEAKIIEQIKQAASTYNQFVEDEKKTGNFNAIVLQDGTESFEFTGDSYTKVQQQEMLTQDEIGKLNNEYYALYEQEKSPTPTTTPSTQAEQQMRLDQLENEEQVWVSNELIHGTTIMIYSNAARKYFPFLIGESYAKEQEKFNEIDSLRLSANMPPSDLIKLDIQRIQGL